MLDTTTTIVIIDDLLTDNDLIVREIKYNYQNVILLKSVIEGIQYIDNNLDKRIIVLLDNQFSKNEPKGDYVLEKIREKTKLIPVILITVNVDTVDNYVKLIKDKVFSIIDNKNDYKLIINTIKDAEQTLSIDKAIEEWIEIHPESDKNKIAYRMAGGKTFTLNEILLEVRKQSPEGKEYAKRLTKLTIDLLMRNRENIND